VNVIQPPLCRRLFLRLLLSTCTLALLPITHPYLLTSRHKSRLRLVDNTARTVSLALHTPQAEPTLIIPLRPFAAAAPSHTTTAEKAKVKVTRHSFESASFTARFDANDDTLLSPALPVTAADDASKTAAAAAVVDTAEVDSLTISDLQAFVQTLPSSALYNTLFCHLSESLTLVCDGSPAFKQLVGHGMFRFRFLV
jgi:hypothetical protein